MSVVFEKTRELGELILKSEEFFAYEEARVTCEKNPESMTKIDEFNKFQEDFRSDVQEQQLSKEEMQKRSEELQDKMAELRKDPIVGALIFSETEYNNFINKVMNILRLTISGQEEDNCSSGCSGCSGCN